jgi:hypothetical protein
MSDPPARVGGKKGKQVSDYKGYRVVAATFAGFGNTHITPWTRWLTREQAMSAGVKWASNHPAHEVRVQSKRGALYKVGA